MTAALRAMWGNEVRALLPLWGLCTLTVLACIATGQPDFKGIAILAYGLGSCAIGAHAFGQEYSHRTLALVLSQPVDRRAILAIKLVTLAAFVTLLGAAGYTTVLRGEVDGPATPAQMAGLVWLVSVLVAPPLAILCRSTLAGTIFSGTVAAMPALIGWIIGWYRFGDTPAADEFQLTFFWRAIPVVCIAAALTTWRTFTRLEAIEGRGREFHLPQWLSGDTAAPRRRHPILALIAKELRLQQMVFAIAGIYVVVAAAVMARHALNPAFSAEILLPLSIMYVALLALVAGALASAEERQLRTLEPQLLVPMAASTQWLVKTAVVLAVALGLAFVLPASVMWILEATLPAEVVLHLCLTVVVLASTSLYVSSLTTSGVRAIAVAAPFVGGGILLVSWAGRLTRGLLSNLTGSSVLYVSVNADLYERIATVVLSAAFVALMLRFAHINHRSVGQSNRAIAWQVAAAAAFVVLAGLATTVATGYPA